MSPEDLTEDSRRILEALTSARLAWLSPCELSQAARLDRELVQDLLADLDVAGWIQLWETEDGIDATLSPIAAVALGVHLVEFGPDELPRWNRNGTPDPPQAKAKGCLTRYSALALLPDRQLLPDEMAHFNEELAKLLPLNLETSSRGAEYRERRRLRDAARKSDKARESRRRKRERMLRWRRPA